MLSVARRERESPSSSNTYAWIGLARACVWPLFLLIVYVNFRQPINDSVRLLPQVIGSTSKVTIGSLALEINRTAEATGDPKLVAAIGRLSPEAVKELLSIGSLTGSWIVFNSRPNWERNRKPLVDLRDKELLVIKKMPPDKSGNDMLAQLTPLGVNAYNVILEAITTQLREPSTSRPAP